MATETCIPEETASGERESDRWLAVSEPLAIDDDPGWETFDVDLWRHETRARHASAER